MAPHSEGSAWEAAPAAATIARPPLWRSPRLLLGVLLVASAVVLGGWAVDRASGGTETLVARSDLTPGQRISLGDLEPVRMGWDGGSGVYLTELPPDAVVVSAVGAGELVPASAIGSAADVDGRPMAVPLPVGARAAAGEVVDLWVVTGGNRSLGDEATAELLAADVLVLGVESDTGPFRSGSGRIARILVPEDVVDRVLEAQAAGEELTVVERAGG
ncbi:hypothetical protein EDD28_0268 [Salana multivorans]|uniref:SAF domain-containing protein n=1 Tax=Salana multivorans TaxID=120377 RepID=A0A3N2D7E3_9MICO|nr:hypothetical protein [Salana multivorans]OJX98306.1 MAG: hypothetical protein BGO96_03725 [Micrococcales bacterium 73-15]ROR95706.1 hypothetical protein EDD28_0268 [Salana multivorans]